MSNLNHQPRFSTLGEAFFSRVQPQRRKHLSLVSYNPLAGQLLDWAQAPKQLDLAALIHEPIASVYAGHQFGTYVPQLGDGRAVMLAEVANQQGDTWELQLKGAGVTPYSRDGDGQAVLRSCVREYLGSEAMAALGVPTTRSLAILATGELVQREIGEPGAMLLRLAQSHIRFGTFEYFYHHDHKALKQLADFVIQHYYPACLGGANPYQLLYEAVIKRTARMIAHWQSVGFVHGVMNTDNLSILGDTFDYGPFVFMDAFQPNQTFNHTDPFGRYNFDEQPQIGRWNCLCLGYALSPFIPAKQIQESLNLFNWEFVKHYMKLMRAKLGLRIEKEQDQVLISDLLNDMAQHGIDFTEFFRTLSDFPNANLPAEMGHWLHHYESRLAEESVDEETRQVAMKQVNPKYSLRTHIAQIAILQAESGKYQMLNELLQCLQNPFAEQPEFAAFALPPQDKQNIVLSCSS